MNEVLKKHFNENEYQKVEIEIEKDNKFKEIYEKIKNNPDYRLNQLAEKIEKTEETFIARFEAFKEAVLDAEKNKEKLEKTEKLEKIKQESYLKLDNIIKEKVWFWSFILWWMWIDLTVMAKQKLDEKLNQDQVPVENNIKNFFSKDNIKKIFWWMFLSMLWINTEIDKITSAFNNSSIALDTIKTAWDNQINRLVNVGNSQIDWIVDVGNSQIDWINEAGKGQIDWINEHWKRILEEAEEKLKSRLPDFNKEKLELDPESINLVFTRNYLLLFMNKGEFNTSEPNKVIEDIKDKNFKYIQDNSKNNNLYYKISSEDSINLISPFLSNKDYLRYVINTDYFKKCFPSRIDELEKSIKEESFDWKKVFTWKEITVILSQKLAYTWAMSIEWIKWVLSDRELLDNIKSLENLETLEKNLPVETRESLNIIKDSYRSKYVWWIKDFNIDKPEYQENGIYDSLLKVDTFSKELLAWDALDNIKKELGIYFDIKEIISGSFDLVSISKLYVMLNWNSDIKNWWDTEKISFITWFSNNLSNNDDDSNLTNFWSSLIKKVLIEVNSEGSFLSEGVKKFLKSWANILWNKFVREEVEKPFNMIRWIIWSNLPDWMKMGDSKTTEYIEKTTASLAMALWLLIMIYPAYRVTNFLTNKYVLWIVLGWSLLYTQTKDSSWLDKIKELILSKFSFRYK